MPSSKGAVPRKTAAKGCIFGFAGLELEEKAAEDRNAASRAMIGKAYAWRCGACCKEVHQLNAHVCKWCGVEVHSSIMCGAVLSAGEGDYFCAQQCVDKWNEFHGDELVCTPRGSIMPEGIDLVINGGRREHELAVPAASTDKASPDAGADGSRASGAVPLVDAGTDGRAAQPPPPQGTSAAAIQADGTELTKEVGTPSAVGATPSAANAPAPAATAGTAAAATPSARTSSSTAGISGGNTLGGTDEAAAETSKNPKVCTTLAIRTPQASDPKSPEAEESTRDKAAAPAAAARATAAEAAAAATAALGNAAAAAAATSGGSGDGVMELNVPARRARVQHAAHGSGVVIARAKKPVAVLVVATDSLLWYRAEGEEGVRQVSLAPVSLFDAPVVRNVVRQSRGDKLITGSAWAYLRAQQLHPLLHAFASRHHTQARDAARRWSA
jgi:hypothetical protein